MQEIIQTLLNGNFNYEKGNIEFSCSELEISLNAGEVYEGSFEVRAQKEEFLHGYVTSTDSRMECLNPEFYGMQEEIRFRFHGENMVEGEEIKGELCVVSNQGEACIAFLVTAKHTQVNSSMGQIKNLFHFTNLAKTNWEEAVRIFYSQAFHKVFEGNDSRYYSVYRGLSRYPGNEQNMEEFLLYIKKKQKIEYITEEKEIRLENPHGTVAADLTLVRNGWGYTNLQIQVTGDFLYVEKETLSDDDFLGNYCRMQVYIQEEKLHAGNNCGQIHFFNNYVDLKIPVRVSQKEIHYQPIVSLRRERKQIMQQIMESYEKFRLKKVSASVWQKESGKLVERMVSMNEKDVSARLFQAQMLITAERYNEAGWILKHTEELLTGEGELSKTLWAYQLYLNSLIHREEAYVDEVAGEVEQIYREYPRAWRVAWLLLYLSEEYGRNGSGKWLFLEEQYLKGCRSPILYIEALQMLRHNPALLTKLSGFEKQVLLFAVKKECMDKEITDQFVYLAEKEKEFSNTVYQILTACYGIREDEGVLRAICSMLIKEGKIENRYFPWYEKAVEKEIRITRLYDYYMLSMDLEKEKQIPKMVLMYFSYYSNLDYEHNAYLFANIHKNRDKFPDLYAGYRGQIENFLMEQLVKRHINRHLAYLYQNILVPEILLGEAAEALSRLIFMNLVEVERENITKVVVYQPQAGVEHCYPVSGKRAYIPFFGSEYTLLFEDMNQNRYVVKEDYRVEKLMPASKMAAAIEKQANKEIGFDVYICERSRNGEQITPGTQQRFHRILESDVIDTNYKKEICLSLMQYYYDNDYIRELDEYLEGLDVSFLEPAQRGILIRLLVLRGNYEKAYSWIRQYGPFHTDVKTLVRLCDYLLEKNGDMEDEFLVGLITYAFRKGKYNAGMIAYLVRYYQGLTKNLRDLWKAAEAFEVDTYKLCERILIQVLFTGSFVGEQETIFRKYVQGGAKPEIEIAFLVQCAYDYFVSQKITDSFVFEEMFRIYKQGEALNRVCKLALLKYYAENKEEVTEGMKLVLSEFLQEMLNHRIYLNFFKDYAGVLYNALQAADKTIIEYYANPEAKTVLHYVLENGDDTGGEYYTKEMKKVFGGVRFQEFVLFFGENLQYYIMEENEGNEQLTESGTLQNSDIVMMSGDSKYRLTNDIVTSSILQDYDTFDELLREYAYKDFMSRRLFRLK